MTVALIDSIMNNVTRVASRHTLQSIEQMLYSTVHVLTGLDWYPRHLEDTVQ
jgi:hypothetical protein